MVILGYIMGAFLVFLAGFMLWAFWQKFVAKRPDLYGKGPGHDLRGPERGQWDRPDK
ncbi:MAG: hypothetical protein AAF822_10270 [Pseudomonadota bacterium]